MGSPVRRGLARGLSRRSAQAPPGPLSRGVRRPSQPTNRGAAGPTARRHRGGGILTGTTDQGADDDQRHRDDRDGERGRPRDAARGGAAGAVALHGDRRPRQPLRANPTGLKVGGHQASSASMVTIMTALWFEHLRAGDRVSVKPHASPVLHAINYLLGELDERVPDDAARVRRPAELPEPAPRTRTRSTTRPARSASARPRRSGARWPAATSTRTSAPRDRHRPAVLPGRRRRARRGRRLGGDPRPDGRRARRGRLDRRPQPAVAGPGRARTSAPPGWQGMFDAAGWQVLTVKYGHLLRGAVHPPRRRRAARGGSTR